MTNHDYYFYGLPTVRNDVKHGMIKFAEWIQLRYLSSTNMSGWFDKTGGHKGYSTEELFELWKQEEWKSQ